MYNHKKIELDWQKTWEAEKLYETKESDKPKYYCLDMFPYPSGVGLHVGHPRGYIATDVFSRYKRLAGFNVLHPMGWDAFGLPAENYALKNKTQPGLATEKNVVNYKRQLNMLGLSYDWSREINTTDPEYYKWTQWAFIQMFKKGLVYESHEPINWCPTCLTGLANEDLDDGKCERCGTAIEKKPMRQWVIKITDYADRLLVDLDKLPEWEEPIKEMQRNWIGRSEGASVKFSVIASPAAGARQSRAENEIATSSATLQTRDDSAIEVFTTRPDTIFGATYLVLAPEHEAIKNYELQITNLKEVEAYIKKIKNKSDLERTDLNKDKTGMEVQGIKAINPASGEEIPVWVADYVLPNYGTGAIMAVPAHDERDFEFAQKYGLPIIQVISTKSQVSSECFSGEGELINSGKYNSLTSDEARKKIIKWLEEKKIGAKKVQYKLKDWVFSRQRYWGEPIPLIHCEQCKAEIETKAQEIRFYEQDTWSRLLSGRKTIESRALNPEEPERYFGNIKIGNYIKAKNVATSELKYFVVKRVWLYKNFAELFKDKDVLSGIYGPKPIAQSLEQLEKDYSYNLGYVDKVNKNGIVAWEVEFVTPGVISVPEDELPLKLPEVEHYEPSGTGESPLAKIADWVNVKCPKCGGEAKRETNTMPQWAGSSWYYLRYCDPHNDKELISKDKEQYWNPVDFYVGGAEHATRHLIYARFWHKFLQDIGVVSDSEPFIKYRPVGLILAEDGRKMSKRWNNVINPDDIVVSHGADALRVYEMFIGPFGEAIAWNTNGLSGVRKFLDRIYRLSNKIDPLLPPPLVRGGKSKEDPSLTLPLVRGGDELKSLLHKTIKKVGEDIEGFKFNTAVSAMMILVNKMAESEMIRQEEWEKFLIILSPFAPYLAEELWRELGKSRSIFESSWPEFDKKLIKDQTINLVMQINGKVRDMAEVEADISEDEAKKLALSSEKIQKWLDGQTPKQIIYVKGRLVNIVLR